MDRLACGRSYALVVCLFALRFARLRRPSLRDPAHRPAGTPDAGGGDRRDDSRVRGAAGARRPGARRRPRRADGRSRRRRHARRRRPVLRQRRDRERRDLRRRQQPARRRLLGRLHRRAELQLSHRRARPASRWSSAATARSPAARPATTATPPAATAARASLPGRGGLRLQRGRASPARWCPPPAAATARSTPARAATTATSPAATAARPPARWRAAGPAPPRAAPACATPTAATAAWTPTSSATTATPPPATAAPAAA